LRKLHSYKFAKKRKNHIFYRFYLLQFVVFRHNIPLHSWNEAQHRADEGDLKMAKPMTKTQLVAALAEEMGTDKKSAGAALEAVCALITKEVSGGGAVTLPGVGKIYCRERPERMVRNPATGEQFKKDADKVVKMTIAKALKDSVNG
jgi:DNA-binding protein HU-beta